MKNTRIIPFLDQKNQSRGKGQNSDVAFSTLLEQAMHVDTKGPHIASKVLARRSRLSVIADSNLIA